MLGEASKARLDLRLAAVLEHKPKKGLSNAAISSAGNQETQQTELL